MASIPGTDIKLAQGLEKLLTPIKDIARDPANPRKAKDIGLLVGMLKRFGYVDAITVNVETKLIEAGHQRLAAVEELGGTHIPVTWVDHKGAEAIAFNIAHNRSNEKVAEWDKDALGPLLKSLNDDGLAEGLGFADTEIEKALRESNLSGAGANEDAPIEDVKPRARLGDLWGIEDHRVACGDSMDPKVHDLLMGDREADLLFTDPPYGVSYTGGGKEWAPIANDEKVGDDLEGFLTRVFEAARVRKGGVVYVCHAAAFTLEFILAFKKCWKMSQCLVWAKEAPTFGRADYQWQHEPIIYGWREGAGHMRVANRGENTLWKVERESDYKHPTQKPVALPARAIHNSTKKGDLVLDIFSGSGSTGVATAQLGRVYRGIELDPGYASLTIARLEQETGGVARLLHRDEKAPAKEAEA